MIDVWLAYEDTDVKVRVPAVPRVGEQILRDAGHAAPDYVVSAVQWYWDMTDPDSDVRIWVFVREGRISV